MHPGNWSRSDEDLGIGAGPCQIKTVHASGPRPPVPSGVLGLLYSISFSLDLPYSSSIICFWCPSVPSEGHLITLVTRQPLTSIRALPLVKPVGLSQGCFRETIKPKVLPAPTDFSTLGVSCIGPSHCALVSNYHQAREIEIKVKAKTNIT